MPSPLEQKNVYRGTPARACLQVTLIAPDGERQDLDLLADTGNPCGLIVSQQHLQQFRWREAIGTQSNFGPLDGGWLRVSIPALEFEEVVLGNSNDQVVAVAKRSEPTFDGLVGLPFLRLVEYGGNDGWFWVRQASA